MRVLSLLLTTSLLLFILPGCGEDSCVKTLTCPRPPGASGGGGTAATGGSGGTTDGGGPSTGGTGGGTTLLDNGESCSAPGACASGFCTDGVCCESTCDGGCEACNVTGLEGSCELHAVGTDPDNECDAGVGICDGNGACSSGALLW